jgi:hypothetical protein
VFIPMDAAGQGVPVFIHFTSPLSALRVCFRFIVDVGSDLRIGCQRPRGPHIQRQRHRCAILRRGKVQQGHIRVMNGCLFAVRFSVSPVRTCPFYPAMPKSRAADGQPVAHHIDKPMHIPKFSASHAAPNGAPKRPNLHLVQVPHALLGVDVAAQLVQHLLLGVRDGDQRRPQHRRRPPLRRRLRHVRAAEHPEAALVVGLRVGQVRPAPAGRP